MYMSRTLVNHVVVNEVAHDDIDGVCANGGPEIVIFTVSVSVDEGSHDILQHADDLSVILFAPEV